jgi:hypothetical protein
LYIQSQRRQGAHKKRLFDLSIKRFESAVATKPDDNLSLTAWGDILFGLYKQHLDLATLQQALEKWKLAENVEKILQVGDMLISDAKDIPMDIEHSILDIWKSY